MSQKMCPECGTPAAYLPTCPNCGADLRAQCPECGLPYSGEGELCRCGAFTEEEREAFYSTSPPKSANRDNGGQGHGWLAERRYNRTAA